MASTLTVKNRLFTGLDLRKILHRAERGPPKESESGFRKKNFRPEKSKIGQNSKNFIFDSRPFYCTFVHISNQLTIFK